MAATEQTIKQVNNLGNNEYKYGFSTDVDDIKSPKGLSEETVKFISAQNVTLYEQHNGRFDYTAIGNTLNIIENGAYFECSILTSSVANLFLESNQIVRSAYLYWAGSGEGDFDIKLNDNDISPIRTFSYSLDANRQFFSAFADITDIVQNHGNGTYILSELDNIDISENYCSTGTNFAGWSIIVLYEDEDLPLNQINIYDGLEAVPNEISITLDNLNVLATIFSEWSLVFA